jgi:hypothetical protein
MLPVAPKLCEQKIPASKLFRGMGYLAKLVQTSLKIDPSCSHIFGTNGGNQLVMNVFLLNVFNIYGFKKGRKTQPVTTAPVEPDMNMI